MLAKSGAGTLTLEGTTPFTGSVSITGGTLSMEHNLSGSVSITTAGTLAGNGTVSQINNSGIVSPGHSIGTIGVAGNYTQTPTGTLTLELGSMGQSDALNVGGIATLAGTLDLVALPGFEPILYTLITADELVGTFSNVIFPLDPTTNTLKYSLLYEPTQLLLSCMYMPVHFRDLNSSNQSLIEYYLCAESSFPFNAQIVDFAAYLAVLTPDQFLNALAQLSPGNYGVWPVLMAESSWLLGSAAIAPKGGSATTPWVVWGTLLGYDFHETAQGAFASVHSPALGAIAGIEHQKTEQLIIGVSAAYMGNNVKWAQGEDGFGKRNSAYLIPYIYGSGTKGYLKGGWKAYLLGAFDDYTMSRAVVIPPYYDYATREQAGGHHGWSWAAFGGVEGMLHLHHGNLLFDTGVAVSADLFHDHETGFQEKEGSSAVALKLQPHTAHFETVTGSLFCKMAHAPCGLGSAVKVSYKRVFNDNNHPYKASLGMIPSSAGCPSTFATISPYLMPKSQFWLEGQLVIERPRWQINLDYQGSYRLLGSPITINSLQASLQMNF